MNEQDLHRQMLEEIRRDMSKAAELMDQLRSAAAYHAQKIGEELPEDLIKWATGANTTNGKVSRKPPIGEFANHKMKHAAEIVLRKAGKPLPTAEIADALLKGGYPARNPPGFRNVVFAMLRKTSTLFRRVDSGLWELKDNTH